MLKYFVVASFICLLPSLHAEKKENCVIKTVKTPCPGKEAEALKHCDGKPECFKHTHAKSLEDCRHRAEHVCSNNGNAKKHTKSKVVTATFDGQPVKTDAGKDDFCDNEMSQKNFNQCDTK